MSTRPEVNWGQRLARLAVPRVAVWAGIGLYAVATAAYVFLGMHNSDEGWYLYASLLVGRGLMPYRDFAYAQMPALPYFYSLALAVLGPSLYAGRLFTAALGLAQVVAGAALARRYAGPRGAAFAALLLGTFAYATYFNTIVKTYALVSLLITLTFLAMPRAGSSPRRWALAVALATLAALVRLSAAAFWLPVALYAVWAVRGPANRLALIAWAAALWAPGLYVITRDPAAARWNLVGFHFGLWHGASYARRVAEVVAFRLPAILNEYAPHVALAGVTLGASLVHVTLRRLGVLKLMALSLVLFAASHLSTGDWHNEYLVPAMAAAMPLLAIGIARAWERAASPDLRRVWGSLVAVTLFAALLHDFPMYIVLNPAKAPVEAIRTAARVVAAHSAPGDKVVALEAVSVVFEAGRDVLHGLELAQTALQPLPDAEARALSIVSPAMLITAVEQEQAKLVVVTAGDSQRVAALGDGARWTTALAEHYRPVWVQPGFGQYADTLTIYECRTCP